MKFRFRRKKVKHVALLPTMLTLGNGVCGFAAVVATSKAFAAKDPSGFATAGWFILLAMVFDALDGKVARLTKMATNFGAQLDSLCDAVSFGLTPAFLAFSLLTLQDTAFPRRFLWMICGLYLVCAIVRLARFNVETSPDESAHEFFKGLPSPAAAGVVAGSALLYTEVLTSEPMRSIMLAGMPFAVLAVALLMVSQVRYVHVVNRLFRGYRSFTRLVEMLVAVLVVGALLVIHTEGALLGGFALYALSGPILAVRARILRGPAPEAQPAPQPQPQEPHP